MEAVADEEAPRRAGLVLLEVQAEAEKEQMEEITAAVVQAP